MPHPSPWAYGVAAPSTADPYQGVELAALGARASGGGLAAGEGAMPSSRKLSGSWKEAFNPDEPAMWFLIALLIGVLVLHVKASASAGAKVGV